MRTSWVVTAGLVLALAGCGDDAPQVRLPAASSTPSASPTPPAPGPSLPRITRPATAPVSPTATTTVTSEPIGGTADLDGDGTLDRVELAGATVTARLSTTGQVESVGLPEDAVGGDVEVLGRSDLDGDGVDEALVRTLRSATGDVRVVLRVAGGGLELLTTEDGRPFELPTAGGLSGPRSYDCREDAASSAGREVRVLDSERDPDGAGDPTFSGEITTWSVSGATALVVGTERFRGTAADSDDLQLDLSTCAS